MLHVVFVSFSDSRVELSNGEGGLARNVGTDQDPDDGEGRQTGRTEVEDSRRHARVVVLS